ncbi:MAG: hypothetical protein WC775_06350 [Patescibacteria group bacterium]|jgi:hypothetical protein
MAKEWVSASQDSVAFGAPIKSGEAGNINKGDFIGINSDGDAVLANSGIDDETAVEARGAAWDDGTVGDAIKTVDLTRIGFVRTNKLAGFSDLTPGGTVYLGSGGGITQTAPSATAEILQVLGFAVTDDTIFIDIAPGEVLT